MFEGAAGMQVGEPLFPIENDEDANDKIGRVLIIACGALAREIIAIRDLNGLDHIDLTCLPAKLHNTPDRIPDEVRRAILMNQDVYSEILIGYGDCGTGGLLDRVLEETGAKRIEGAHCYAFFSGLEEFEKIAEEELGTFYLTDFLARHFQTMVIEPLGLDWHPHLRDMYFAHYKRLVYLAQTDDPSLEQAAKEAAERLNLTFELRRTGYGMLSTFLRGGDAP
ncbi:DUF1638 domain-containing protein [uncultured Roseibium sp.]|uniref:DUF1638 domain-containing protein n=2 Tax=uncultured Roseibium sp. TaxID=1936171 RepID=UPI00260FA629|nr:DUF1638 domain-containing protein [uncultured Roseibium sp.]